LIGRQHSRHDTAIRPDETEEGSQRWIGARIFERETVAGKSTFAAPQGGRRFIVSHCHAVGRPYEPGHVVRIDDVSRNLHGGLEDTEARFADQHHYRTYVV